MAKICKKSKIILFVTAILALITALVGFLVPAIADDTLIDSDKIKSLSAQSSYSSAYSYAYGEKAMFKLSFSESAYYTINVYSYYDNFEVYLLTENSKDGLSNYVKHKVSSSRAVSFSYRLSTSNTYYLYVVAAVSNEEIVARLIYS